MKKVKLSNGILILLLIAGLSLLLYPSLSDYYNSFHQSQAIAEYKEAVAQIDDRDYTEFWTAAIAYNESLTKRGFSYDLNRDQKAKYNEILNLNGSGLMAYIEIPKIKVHLPIYHGTDEGVLQTAIGHIEWSSLPVGGESSHCVVSGHRGLPSAKLFTDLNQLEENDTFMIHVMDETLTYKVDQIKIVEPREVEDLVIEQGRDLVTLVTCTPYGVNSHRLLVRGQRTENAPVVVERRVTADAVQVEPVLVACALVAPCVLLGIAVMLIGDSIANRIKKRKK